MSWPGQKSGDDSRPDVHEIVHWTPNTPFRRLLHFISTTGVRAGLVVLVFGLFLYEFDFATVERLSDPVLVTYVALSALPALAIAVYVWYVDASLDTPIRLLTWVFVLGGLVTSLALVGIGLFGSYLTTVLEPSLHPGVVMALVFVLIAAPIEELLKLLVVRVYAFDSEQFSSVMSGALFGAMVGLGFATVENAVSIADTAPAGSITPGDGGVTATVRALSGPGHVIYSAIAGYYLGLARFNPRYRTTLVFQGLTIAILFHATYNILVSRHTLDAPGVIAELFGISHIGALFTVTIGFNGLIFIFLFHKLSAYRNAQRGSHDTPDSRPVERTEFDS